MALQYTYPDEYLKQRVTEDREARAIAYVDTLGITEQADKDKLNIIKAYIITALECSSNDDDNFAAKYKIYSKEFSQELSTIQAKQREASGGSGSLYNVSLGRS